MTTFAYTAIDRGGRRAAGTVPAESRAAAMDAVAGLGLTPIDLREQTAAGQARVAEGKPVKVPKKSVEAFTRELANLLAGGLSLSRALALLKREASHPAAKHVWGQIHDDVVGGESLADALDKWPGAFGEVYVAMVRAGEAGGFLHVVLAQIGEFRQREQDLAGKVKAALIYPAALAVIATGVMIFLLTFFIPRFTVIFEQFGEKLPIMTRLTIAVSAGLLTYGPFLAVAAIVGAIALKRAAATPAGRRRLDAAWLRVPVLGTVLARFALVRFCRMLGTLIGSGVPMIASLKVAKTALGNQTLSDAVAGATEEVRRGTPLSRALSANAQLFPPSVVEMVGVAEETGRLGEELLRLSTAYEADLDRNLRLLVALAEPLMLLIMAGLIGTVVVSMLLPLFTLQDMIN